MPQLAMAAGAAAGSAAGGLLKQAIGGKKEQEPVPRIDFNPAMAMMSGAIQSLGNYERMGLGAYTDAIYSAQDKVKQAYSSIASQLNPLSAAGTASYNEYLRMTGQDPIQATAGFGDRINSLGLAGDTSQLSGLINAATKERDQAKRIEYQDLVQQALAKTTLQDDRAKDIAALGAAPTAMQFTQKPFTYVLDKKTGQMKIQYDEPLLAQIQGSVSTEFETRNNAYKQQVADINRKWDQKVAEAGQARSEFANDFSQNYGQQYDGAYNADQINKKVSESSGYQVAFQQGQQAVGRIGAAAGMLGSGNTMLAAQKAGQDLASNTYQTTLSNLLGSAEPGLNATSALADLKSNTASLLANLDTSLGSQTYNTMLSTGQATYQGIMQQAQSYLQTTQQNMNNLLTYRMQQKELDAKKGTANAQVATAVIGQQGATDRLGMQLGAQAAQGYGLLSGFNQQSNSRYGRGSF